MPVPHELLKTAIGILSDDTLCRMAEHCGKPMHRSRAELVDCLASDDGTWLISYSYSIPASVLKKIAKVFSIDTGKLKEHELRYAISKFISDFDRERARDKFHHETGIPRLSGEELLAEVLKMTRPCIHLTTNSQDGPFAGVWRGDGIVPIDLPQHKHWLTLDLARLPEEFAPLHLAGAASIYSDESPNALMGEFPGGCVVVDPQCVFTRSPDTSIRIGNRTRKPGKDRGAALYARAGNSYPSSFQVIDSPTPAIRDWLRRMGHSLESGDYYTPPAAELRDTYEDCVSHIDPSRSDESIVAVVGGWGIDVEFAYASGIGDNYQLVFTLWESEPWIQAIIGKKTGKFHVRKLIT